MVIANPIYDVAFKFLMDDERVAKFFIGTLLEETIEEVLVRPQEYSFTDQLAGLAVFRLDFGATIRNKEGVYKKVLVEIQKAKNRIDLMRFRNYLGEQYKKEDEAGGRKQALPIITIYLLGFNLTELESSVIKVNREYMDLITHQVLDKKSDFIERLTHDCYVVQLGRIESKVGTKLEKLLSIFEQHYFVDGDNTLKEYKHRIDDDNIGRMVEKLHYVGTEPSERKKIEDEREAYRVLDWATEAKTNELLKVIESKDKALEDSKKLIEELKRRLGEK